MDGYRWERLTASTKIANSKVCVGEVILTADAVGNADIVLYDGETDSDPEIAKLKALQHDTKVIVFQPYLTTERGLYIKFGSNVSNVLVLISVGKQ